MRPIEDEDADADADDEAAEDAEDDSSDDDDDDDAEMEAEEAEAADEMEGHRLPCESTRYRRAMSGVSEVSASR